MTGRGLRLRPTRDSDLTPILALHRAAFGPEEGPVIADLVEALLADPSAEPRLSLLAEQAGEVLGHILFTRATLSPDAGGLRARLRQAGVDLVFVLGSPGYYPRFNFTPCRAVAAPYPIPAEHAEAWMVQALTPAALGRVQGAGLGCATALDRREYWGD